jgi:dolichol-phosphate mannosyltransferase
MLAWGLASTTDPMSGFFCTTKTLINKRKDHINPIGFKIALEIMVRSRARKIMVRCFLIDVYVIRPESRM